MTGEGLRRDKGGQGWGRGTDHEGDGVADEQARGGLGVGEGGRRPTLVAAGAGRVLRMEVRGEQVAELDARRVVADVGMSRGHRAGLGRGLARTLNKKELQPFVLRV